MPADDPHPNHSRFVGRQVSFDHNGKRLVGVVERQVYIGRENRGAIPDYRLSVRGQSGAVLEVSLVDNYCSFPESP